MFGSYDSNSMPDPSLKRYRIYRGKVAFGRDENMVTGDFIGGYLRGISSRMVDSSYQSGEGGQVKLYDLEFEDDKTGEHFILTLAQTNGSSRDIFRCLKNIDDFKDAVLKIDVRLSEDTSRPGRTYTNAYVRSNGVRVKWAEDFPKPEKVEDPAANGGFRFDFSNVYAAMDEIADELAERLGVKKEEDDLPAATAEEMHVNEVPDQGPVAGMPEEEDYDFGL